MNPLHVMIIHVHDAGRFIGPYGYDVPTPALQSLAEEGVLFRRAFSCAPTCSPSRAAMLTGMYPHEAGMLGLAHRGFSLKRTDRHLAQLLSERGWKSVLAGVQHEVHVYSDLGYEEYIGEDPEAMFKSGFAAGEWDRRNADAVQAFLREQADLQEQSSRPFFLFWGLFNPHRPYPESDSDLGGHTNTDGTSAAVPEMQADYSSVPLGLPDSPEIREDAVRYKKAMYASDQQISRVLDVFHETGLDEQSLLIFTTDHGIAFPGHKCTLKDTGCGVSFIVRPPGSKNRQTICEALISHLDVVPTILDYAGSADAYDGDGRSLRPILELRKGAEGQDEGSEADASVSHSKLFSEINYHAAYEPARAVRIRRYAYIKRFGVSAGPNGIPANIDDSPAKDLLWNAPGGLKDRHFPEEELYDLLLDPNEMQNLSQDSQYASIRRELGTALDQWMERTQDPLLHGIVPAPQGALIDNVRDYSPSAQSAQSSVKER